MCPAPNKCGGDHNHPKLQALTEDVLIKTIKHCPSAKSTNESPMGWSCCKNFTTKRNDQNGSWKDFSQAITEYWSDPKNREAHGEAMTKHWSDSKNGEAAMAEYWSDPKSTEQHEKLNELMIAQWKAQPFNPEARYHTWNQWRKSGLLRQPYQCTKCGTQFQGETFAYLHHMENCNHSTTVLMSSAHAQLLVGSWTSR